MKNSTKIKKVSITALLILLPFVIIAQDIYLPVSSTKNKEVKKLYHQAMDALVNLDFPTSRKIADKALEIDPDFFMGRYITLFNFTGEDNNEIIKKLVAYKGKMSKAEKLLQEAIITYNNNPDSPVLPHWDKLVEAYPKNVFVVNFHAWFVMNEGKDPEDAINLLKAALEKTPNWAPYYNLIGYANLNLKNYPEAEKAFNKYIELTPQYANPYDSKGDYYMAVEDYENAHKSFMKAFEVDDEFIFSKNKAEKAKRLHKCELVKPEVEKVNKEFLDLFLNRDLKKHHSYYNNDGSFRFIWNGKHNFTLDEIINMDKKNLSEWKNFDITTTETVINMLTPKRAVVYQNFKMSVEKHDGTSSEAKGNISLIWEKKKDESWKLTQAIQASHKIK
jgi:tetratricopeptide (TPR) repeat protein